MISTLEKREDKELLQLKREEIILDKLKTKQRCFERASLGLKNIPECLKIEVKWDEKNKGGVAYKQRKV